MKKVLFGALAFFLSFSLPLGEASNIASSYMPSGMVFAFAGVNCPSGSLAADGSSVVRTGLYAPLFAAIDTNWGFVDSTHFNLPDMRGQFMRGSTATITGGLITALPGSNQATIVFHGFNHSGVPVQLTGTPPTGLSTATTYYIIYVDASTVKFASSLANALAGTAISISGSTGATVSQWVDPDAGSRQGQAVAGATSGVGSAQTDQLASHTHTTTQNYLFKPNGAGADYSGGDVAAQSTNTINPTGGNETRSKNLYVLYCIKL